MPMPFARSMRSLETDGFRGVAFAFVCAGALLAAWGAWFVLGRVTVYEVTEAARLEVADSVHPIDARVAGRVVVTHLDLGRPVQAGEVLVELDADKERLRLKEEQTTYTTFSSQLSAIGAEIAAESQALDAAKRAAVDALDEARSQLAEAEPPAKFAENEAARLTRLRADGLISEVDELRTRAEAQQRRAAADSLGIGVRRLEGGHRTEEQDRHVRIERLRGELTRLRGTIATTTSVIERLENEIERRRIRAPVKGRLGEVAELRIGAFVAEGQKLGASLLTGLRVAESGLLLLDGVDRQTLGVDGWRRRIVAAPQFHENHVFMGTFAFNLLMGDEWPPRPADFERAETLCRDLGLGDLLARMPAGLLQQVGETGWQLSHGE